MSTRYNSAGDDSPLVCVNAIGDDLPEPWVLFSWLGETQTAVSSTAAEEEVRTKSCVAEAEFARPNGALR